jgi:ABC-2 type transport system ATP-binding protein
MELSVSELYKSFGEKKVLEGVEFKAGSGSALGLLGRNGAGKTTTIRIIMGVFPPDSGRVTIDGSPIDRDKLSIGYLPEDHGLYPKHVISEQLVYLAQLHGMKTKDAKASIARWMRGSECRSMQVKSLLL